MCIRDRDPTALRLFAEEDLGMIAPGREQELYIPDPREAQPIVPTRPTSPDPLQPPTSPTAPASPDGGTP